ncbi:MAG: DinB family protein [Candidatus Limnocylindrales bacterium]|nr:DinB family protein [Candidatus Limnocylindrales bacterium]
MTIQYAPVMSDLIGDLVDILRIDSDRWRALAGGLDRDLLARAPAPGEWSALECLGHAADTEAVVFAARIRAIKDGRPELPSYDPDVQGTPVTPETDPVALAERLAAQRRDSLALLATVTDEDLDRTSRHLKLGPVTLRALLNEWAAHDMMHLVQAERAVMQPFIPNSGPWRFSFADHDIGAQRPDS